MIIYKLGYFDLFTKFLQFGLDKTAPLAMIATKAVEILTKQYGDICLNGFDITYRHIY